VISSTGGGLVFPEVRVDLQQISFLIDPIEGYREEISTMNLGNLALDNLRGINIQTVAYSGLYSRRAGLAKKVGNTAPRAVS
jgi:hypothetical protein